MSEVSIHLMILKIEIKCLKSRNIKLKTRAMNKDRLRISILEMLELIAQYVSTFV